MRLIVLALLAVTAPAAAQLRVQLTEVPAGTPADAAIFIAGSFNSWNPAAPEFRLRAQPGGGYAITLPGSVRGSIEFKFTLGSWDAVETTSSGGGVANRTFVVPKTGKATYTATVAGWQDPRKVKPRAPSATRSVSILTTDFEIPQLGRTRRVVMYLPPGYATSNKAYPVLYMHDAQNVFDDATSYAGEWGVDEALDSLSARVPVMVVAVDHGGDKRVNEYLPWDHPRFGDGEGKAYVEFLVHTLKPYIDQHYRTLPDAPNTAIAGSSMGGLISLYAALQYPNVFSKVGVFSPALWIAPAIVTRARDLDLSAQRPKLYFISATSEAQAKEQLAVSEPLMAALTAAGYRKGVDLTVLDHADGAHSEWFWRREFPAAFLWLFGD